MRGLFLQRDHGKTTASIYTSAMTGCPIIVANEISKYYIWEMSERFGLSIPEPICIYECTRGKRFQNGVLIDNAGKVIRAWTQENLDAPVVAFTITIDDSKKEVVRI